ncbi:undecaprenyl diphosphate synthase family protein [Leptolyngbya sp. 15MV]|nr:undecaprenyl diphosphate synthase family protein [Leptolyngbya sp. 15MV]
MDGMSAAARVAVPGGASGGAVPRHVGIIMDGNGRWAAARGAPRAIGHKAGAEAARRVVEAAGQAGIGCRMRPGSS